MSTPPALKKYFSPAEYLEMEEAAEYKSEYHDGEIFAPAGTTSDHNIVNGNVYARMNLAFSAKDCAAYINDVKLWIETRGFFAYPDIAVVCGKVKHYENRKDTITNPILIVEVLSNSTKEYDHGTKLRENKMSCPTISHYPTLCRCTAFRRAERDPVQRDKILARLGEGLPFVLLI